MPVKWMSIGAPMRAAVAFRNSSIHAGRACATTPQTTRRSTPNSVTATAPSSHRGDHEEERDDSRALVGHEAVDAVQVEPAVTGGRVARAPRACRTLIASQDTASRWTSPKMAGKASKLPASTASHSKKRPQKRTGG